MDFLRNTSQQRIGLMLAFGTLVWSGTYNALAKGLTPFLSPVALLIISEALTAVFIIATFGLVPLLKKLAKLDAKTIRICIIVGLLNSAVAPLLWFTGLSYTTAINATMLSSAEMIVVLILGHFLLKEEIGRMQAAGMMTVLSGIVIINVASFGTATLGVHVGDILVIAGGVVAGTGIVLFKKYLSHVMPELAIVIRSLAGILAVSFVSVLLQQSISAEVSAFPLEKVLLLLAFAFFSRYLNLMFFYEALERLSASKFSMIMIASPLSGVLFAFLILGETVHSYHVLGGIFIILGLFLEQTSAQSIRSFRTTPFMHHFRFRAKPLTTPAQTIQILPKNV